MTMSWEFFPLNFLMERFSPFYCYFFHQNKNVWIRWQMEGLHLYSNQLRTNSHVCMYARLCVLCAWKLYMGTWYLYIHCYMHALCVLLRTVCVGPFCVCLTHKVCCVCTWCVCWCEYVDIVMPQQNSKSSNSRLPAQNPVALLHFGLWHTF